MRRRIDNEGDMSRMAHTPGPWHVEDEFVFDKRGLRVADTITADGQDGISDEEADANALLIAAAPELLQAAQQADAYIRFVIYEGKLPNVDAMPLLKLRAAIAKATSHDA